MHTRISCPLQRGAYTAAKLPFAAVCLPNLATLRRKPSVIAHARYSPAGGGWSPSPGIVDRVVAALPYILPYFDAVSYGRYLFHIYPAAKAAIQPFLPAMALYHSLPFGSFIAFFGLYIGVVNNPRFSRFVRFNAVQAILLDILLALPRLLETVLTPPASGWGAQLYIQSQSFIWVFTTMWVAYGVVSSFLGQWARIPFIAEAADQQIR
ncbi:hypothetical protein VOLCADRAFT_64140 [Volvox carteri f. nagariensis]|uniref:Protein TIC 20 n=1 Tax=Volvox carteri f. nagariensis TaxID=3068 RepID=D8U5R8_VOLCA|nr:uncharacterized protein VOLCADRAFT_64140 [Volvox carteri f. nagariensis]EFJ44968.1 hypothetical protein VOLCADRAFT_64140 [Volvox carteri f. nagariensis]|eukprot:XP_002953939.1 hypothetical protein VOLCADRAFT_64140 [Volvox carteri f. nagariensis]